ncbi:class I SAM-dependent methyltransferase [Thermodesulforhabdus norvegica]|uniref:Methyltransferase domain-containing protein n=1 Tax=Thermodesulforhabdus norvegica TaxID=39841 RepID=A0A1I4S7Z2_9BACT|nr:methyltransferase domain-containing protein [Thermodesulforhabdus norvegica]SFM60628.1 Methyltransferase domain-containing protein [Thermodesulforhabdus norvegica]
MLTKWFLKMLNREAASQDAQKIIQVLRIREGDIIADIGSGGGYFTLEFAKRVGNTGRVYAVDIRSKYLQFVKSRAREEGIDNIVLLLSKKDRVELPENALDLIFCRNVFHHLKEPSKYFSNLKKSLKADGRVAIIDYKPRFGFDFVSFFRHYTPEEVIKSEMKKEGYFLVESFSFLSEQSFHVFGVNSMREALR